MESKTSSYRWFILAICILAYTIVIFHRMSPAVMSNVMMKDLGVNAAFMGLLASAYFYPYAFLQIPSGILSDKASPKKLMTFALLCASIGTFLFAIGTSSTIVFIGRLCVGIGCALILMPAYKALANWFDKKTYTIIISSVLAVAVGIGSMFAGMPLAYIVENFGWRISSQGLFVVTAALTVLTWIFFKDSDSSQTQVENTKQDIENIEEKISILDSIKLVVKNSNFWIIALVFTANASILFGFVGLWAGLYYTEVGALTRNEMSSLLSVAAGITIFTPIIFATIAQKSSSRKIVIMLANAALFAIFVYLYMRNGSFAKYELYTWGIALSIVITAPAGLYMAAARELYAKNIASTANGLVYSISMAGSAIMQPVIGIILDKAGFVDKLSAEMFQPICLLFLICTGLAFAGTFFIREKNGQLI